MAQAEDFFIVGFSCEPTGVVLVSDYNDLFLWYRDRTLRTMFRAQINTMCTK